MSPTPTKRGKSETFRPVTEEISERRDNYPHSAALSYGDRNLSYQELDQSANQFAGYLAQLGVEPGGTVAICVERSFDWITAALGTMRAGAAYVPLDSAWPDSRLRFAVEDSCATVLVARPAVLDRLQARARGIDLCRDAEAIASATALAPRHIQPDSLVYVVYTSGSTGVPKGAEITHANLAHLIRWHQDAFNVTRRDRASHLAGLGFDAAEWEIWPYLSAGATICLADDTVRSSPHLIQQWMIRERVTIGFVPTVHAVPMMAMEWPVTAPLRLLLTGGEVLDHAPAVQLPFDVVNNYGPSECTVVATSSVVKPGSDSVPPIGRPIAGTSVYLLNQNGEPVPDGSIGEIYIAGGGVGRGYRNLPDLTGRSFLPDPFSAAPHGRMYRSGDRGVRRPDGEIEFRGRLDRQTKIRGQRVELDEIGSILTQHASIDFAAAITNISPKGEKQLIAYILPKRDVFIPSASELQKFLRGSLPDYMIPTVFAQLRALPLSANGKIDLTMLPQFTDGNLRERVAAKAPATPIEEKLLAMVRKLLENDGVGAEDSFFLAGGHSLLSMQLVMLVRKEFAVDLTLRQLFEAPTVERLASLVGTLLTDTVDPMRGEGAEVPTKSDESIAVAEPSQRHVPGRQLECAQRSPKTKPVLPPGVLALQPHGTRNAIFWLDYLCIDLAKAIGDDQPLVSVALTAKDFALLGEAPTMQNMATCALSKIMDVQPKGPYIIGGYCRGGIIAYEIASQLRATGNQVSLLVLLDAPNPSFIESCDSLKRKLSYLRYALKRAAGIGVRKSLGYFFDHLPSRFTRRIPTRSPDPEAIATHEMMQAATLAYHPKMYDGEVLLLLASDRPPHVNFLPGWQAVVRHDLHMRYLHAHHRDLLIGRNAQAVADAILFHLSAMGNKPLSSNRIPESASPTSGTRPMRRSYDDARDKDGKQFLR